MEHSHHLLVQQARDGVKLLVSGAIATLQAEDINAFELVAQTRRLLDEVVDGIVQLGVEDCRLSEMVALVETMQAVRGTDHVIDDLLNENDIPPGAWSTLSPRRRTVAAYQR